MQRWLAVLVLFSGCAFGLSAPDPDRPRSKLPKCDTSKALVALDGAMALTSGLIAVSIAGETEPAVALLPLSIGAIYLAGAVRGNSNVNKCRAAMGEFESYAEARDTPRAQRDDVVLDEEQARRMRPELEPGAVPPRESSQPPAPVAVVPAPVAPQPAAPSVAASTPAPPAPAAPASAKPPVARPAAKPAAKPAPRQTDDDWSDFWREVE